MHRVGNRLGELGLAGAGVVLEQEVALGEQAGQRQADDVVLAANRLTDISGHLRKGGREPLGLLCSDAHVISFSLGQQGPASCWAK